MNILPRLFKRKPASRETVTTRYKDISRTLQSPIHQKLKKEGPGEYLPTAAESGYKPKGSAV